MSTIGVRARGSLSTPQLLLAILAGVALLWLMGCSIHEEKQASGEKKVDIQTPFANLRVNTEVDPKETGLPVYPGARRVMERGDNHDAANVTIASSMFGLKVVAIKFESDDAPDKVLAFYRDKLKQYGPRVLECQGQYTTMTEQHGDADRELTCGKHERHTDGSVELKAGTPDRQHVVGVKPHGKGTEFALVYVSKHGKEGEL